MTRKKRDFNLFDPIKKAGAERVSDRDYIDELEQPDAESEEDAEDKTPKRTDGAIKDYIRHTFIIHPTDLKTLQAVVHEVKKTGRYQYTQKQALHESIEMLRESMSQRIGKDIQP